MAGGAKNARWIPSTDTQPVSWQAELVSVQDVNVKHVPQLVLLRAQDEDPSHLVDAPPEQLLLRWLNYHLTRSSGAPRAWGSRPPVANFSQHLSDGVAMLGLLRSLAPDAPLDWRSAYALLAAACLLACPLQENHFRRASLAGFHSDGPMHSMGWVAAACSLHACCMPATAHNACPAFFRARELLASAIRLKVSGRRRGGGYMRAWIVRVQGE